MRWQMRLRNYAPFTGVEGIDRFAQGVLTYRQGSTYPKRTERG